MASPSTSIITDILERDQDQLLTSWLHAKGASTGARGASLPKEMIEREMSEFLQLLADACRQSDLRDISGSEWDRVRDMLGDLSRSRAMLGFSPGETAMFLFSFKQPMFELLQKNVSDGADLTKEIWKVNVLLDRLGLYTIEVFQKSREDVIARQHQEMLELSTPVVQLWDGILALPLIGTLDSARTQVVMENLLEEIVSTGSDIAIIDITGVPTVDTLVAQHLLKTVAAARLMGAECVISGIRPQIAQTIVHLGVALGDVITKARLADAFRWALQRRDLRVAKNAV